MALSDEEFINIPNPLELIDPVEQWSDKQIIAAIQELSTVLDKRFNPLSQNQGPVKFGG